MTATLIPPGGGRGYEWSADHTFVKVGAAETGGAYALLEDNLKPGFRLALHMHATHAETFYILEGALWFWLNGAWHLAEKGTCIHVPPGVPHEVELPEGGNARMLMIYQPSGFDAMLAEMATMSTANFADPRVMAALNARFDIVPLGDAPKR